MVLKADMTKTILLLIVSGVLGLYGAERYSELTREEIAYVYHPETDRVYSVVLGAVPDRLFKKYLLLPFHSLSREVKIAEEQGSMRALLRNMVALERRLSLTHTHARSESAYAGLARWAETSRDSVRMFGYRWDFPDLAWVPRGDLDTRELLPLELMVILPVASATWFWDNLFPIDAVVVKEQFRSVPQTGKSSPNGVDVLEEAVMIRGEAARYLEELLFIGSAAP